MKNPRFTGLLLLLAGVLVLMGNTMDVLPPEAFWAGLLTYPIGGYLFFMGSREAIERIETRTARALNPQLKNAPGDSFARLQARSSVHPHAPELAGSEEPSSGIGDSPRRPAPSEPLALHDLQEEDTDFKAESDVSFPVEIQERQSLADQLEKLTKLQQQGIISAEEYAVAKAKLLS
jgi:hypothetical protein